MLLESHKAMKALEYTSDMDMNLAFSFIPLFQESKPCERTVYSSTPQETF